jgi:DHA1 family tetracycline resistance protein-like MFS transporter
LAESEIPAVSNAATSPAIAGGKRRAAAAFIFFTVTLDMLALGMIAPVLPRLISTFLANNAVRTTEMLGIFGTLWALMQFFFSPVLGSLSDRFGRRPVVLLSNFGLGLDYLLMAWAPTLSWLFVGRIISGITSSSIPTAMAYMADVTPREKRAASFGMLSAAFGMGFVLGPAVGGLLGTVNPRLPFWVAGGLSLMNALYGLVVLPESLAVEHRGRFSWKRANPVGSLALLKRHRALLGMAALLLFGYIAQQSLMNVWVVYADYRYGWTDRTVGFSLAVVGIFSGLVGGLLVKPAVKAMGERGTILLGLIFGSAGYAAFGLSRTGLLFWCAIPFFCLMSLVWPSAQSLMTHGVGPSEQGQLQGAINSVRGLAGLIGPGLFTYIFSRSIGASAIVHVPGMPFYVAAAMLLVSLVFAERTAGRHAMSDRAA